MEANKENEQVVWRMLGASALVICLFGGLGAMAGYQAGKKAGESHGTLEAYQDIVDAFAASPFPIAESITPNCEEIKGGTFILVNHPLKPVFDIREGSKVRSISGTTVTSFR